MRRAIAAFCIAAASFAVVDAKGAPSSKWAVANPKWVEPAEPFRIHGDIYYVGTRGLSSFLIATPDGHFLIDGGLPENASLIAANVKALGFDIRDVKFLLNSHAHFDHSGGLSRLKELSGAAMVASGGDKSALEGGFYLGFEDKADLGAPPVKVDYIVADGEQLTLGGVALTAHLTPGHTRGCTSWTMESGGIETLFFCSASVALNRLVDPPQYDGIVEDYLRTFEKTADWKPDIFLANHPEVFGMEERRARQIAGEADAFIDTEAFPAAIAASKAAFEKAFAEQTLRTDGR